jgi:hypothetical protein
MHTELWSGSLLQNTHWEDRDKNERKTLSWSTKQDMRMKDCQTGSELGPKSDFGTEVFNLWDLSP